MFANGDKIIVTKTVNNFLKEGDIAKIVDVNDGGLISFAFGDGFIHKGLMSTKECEEYFKKYEEPKKEAPTVTLKQVEEILRKSKIETMTVFDKCTIVSCQLPNGFIIVESSACVSPENYDEEMGIEICLDRIGNKIWELEGYRLQQKLYDDMGTDDCPYNCNECPCDGCDDEEEYDDDVCEENDNVYDECADCPDRHDCWIF